MRNPNHRSALIALLSLGPLVVAACGDSGTCSGPLCGDGNTIATVRITTTTLPAGELSVAYALTMSATGGDGSYSWAVTSGSLPAGLSLNATSGAITGTPTVVGTTNFTVAVTSGGQDAQRALSITVISTPVLPVLQPSELCSDNPGSAIVTFEDANLEVGVRLALSVGAQEDLTCGRISGLTSLPVQGFGIFSVVGAQNLTSLVSLDLGNNSISEISALSKLTSLTSLNLGENSITDISVLSELTSLTFLELSGNSFSDISALSGLTSLTSMFLNGNSVIDISTLSGFTSLTSLHLEFNSITDISALSGLTSLTFLNAAFNSISDINALGGPTSLTFLDLSANTITDIGALDGLTSLMSLNLSENAGLDNIQPLLDNTGLGAGDTVDLRFTSVSCTDVRALQAKGVLVVPPCL